MFSERQGVAIYEEMKGSMICTQNLSNRIMARAEVDSIKGASETIGTTEQAALKITTGMNGITNCGKGKVEIQRAGIKWIIATENFFTARIQLIGFEVALVKHSSTLFRSVIARSDASVL